MRLIFIYTPITADTSRDEMFLGVDANPLSSAICPVSRGETLIDS